MAKIGLIKNCPPVKHLQVLEILFTKSISCKGTK